MPRARATADRRARQVFHALTPTGIRRHSIPAAEEDVLPGVAWGRCEEVFTPAYWAERYWHTLDENTRVCYRLGETLAEEVVACLLGGHGLPAEVGLAAYHRLKERGLCRGSPSRTVIEAALREPLIIRERGVRYRFPTQRARFIAAALQAIDDTTIPTSDLALRDFLDGILGIGRKTASWITRNWMDSDRVAIIDIHLQRACVLAGVFPRTWEPAKHYDLMEERFLVFAHAIAAQPSRLDNLIWNEMRLLVDYIPRIDVYQRSA